MEWLHIALWCALFIGSLLVLLPSSKIFIKGAKELGSAAGMTPFASGVLLVGLGTSLPELSSSILAAYSGNTQTVVANVIGSNVTNILLIVGLLAAVGGRVVIQKDLIKNELPIFFISTAFFIAVVYDGTVDILEALLLLGTFCAYLWYLFVESKEQRALQTMLQKKPFLNMHAIGMFFLGVVGVITGAHFAVVATSNLTEMFAIPTHLFFAAALVIGTSLPELFVAWHAYKMDETDIAIGNIFGANAINILVVIGIPALIAPLVTGGIVHNVGLPILIAASAIFFVNGLSMQVMRWEGIMMLLFFSFFLVKLLQAA